MFESWHIFDRTPFCFCTQLVAKNVLQKLESDLSDSETTLPNNERHDHNQYEFMSLDRTACEKQVLEEWSRQPADTGNDPVYFHDLRTQDDGMYVS